MDVTLYLCHKDTKKGKKWAFRLKAISWELGALGALKWCQQHMILRPHLRPRMDLEFVMTVMSMI